jgi:hypothetical protein
MTAIGKSRFYESAEPLEGGALVNGQKGEKGAIAAQSASRRVAISSAIGTNLSIPA